MKFRRILLLLASFLLLGPLLWAGGAKEKETGLVLKRPPQYIAPGNPAAGSPALTIDQIQLDIDKRGVVKSWSLNIYDKGGELIYTKAEENKLGRGIIQDVLNIGEIPAVKVPASIVWPGTDASGKQVADGEYFYQLTVLDSFGKKTSTPPLSVVVDTAAPEIFSLEANQRVLSPNGDGVRDSVTITVRSGPLASWVEEVLDAKKVVKFSRSTKAPGLTAASDLVISEPLGWDGRDDKAVVLAEGAYTYRFTGRDRAGNSTVRELPLAISFAQSNAKLSLSEPVKAWRKGVTAVFVPLIPDQVGMTSWALEIFDAKGIVQRRFSGKSVLPASLEWPLDVSPGKPDSPGAAATDGTYKAILRASFESGIDSESGALNLLVDNTPPQSGLELDSAPKATARGNPLYVGTESKPFVVLKAWAEANVAWKLIIESPTAGRVAEFPSETLNGGFKVAAGALRNELQAQWDPKDLADGLYTMYFEGSDEAGNIGTSNKLRFIMDSLDRGAVQIELSDSILAPQGDAGKDTLTARFKTDSSGGLQSAVVQILPLNDGERTGPVASQLFAAMPEQYTWAGRQENGQAAKDGMYFVRIMLAWLNGEQASIDSEPFQLGWARPQAKVGADKLQFSPNADGQDDTLTISQSGSEEALWTGVLRNSNNEPMREWTWEGQPKNLVWDGLDANGVLAPDGEYSYELSAQNSIGNSAKATLSPLRLDMLGGSVSLAVSGTLLTPNGDSRDDVLRLDIGFRKGAEVRSWDLRFIDEKKNLAKSITGTGPQPVLVRSEWDGSAQAEPAADGRYTITLSVWYQDGRETSLTHPVPILLYTSGARAGIRPYTGSFSPDGDGESDEARFLLVAQENNAAIASWSVEILDQTASVFRSFRGQGKPQTSLVWDGKGNDGTMVLSGLEYTAVLELVDVNGVSSKAMASIRTDILLIPVAGGYKIDLPGIQFGGNSPSLFSPAPKDTELNLTTLRRLAWILKQFPDYTIVIKGHATHTSPPDAAARKREQEQSLLPLSKDRAREVMEALVILGVDWSRMSSEGVGGLEPLVPHEDVARRWMNRRVEFIIRRK